MTSEDLFSYVDSQIKTYFPDGSGLDRSLAGKRAFAEALDRTDECFKHILLRGYSENGQSIFNHLHGDQYSQFIYMLSNSIWHEELDPQICQKLLNLNRVLNSIFISYKLDLPPHFLLGHAIGTILGNASFGDCFVVFQNVTVNTGGEDGTSERLPIIGKGVFFGAGSTLLGRETVGDRVSFSANSRIYNREIPNDSVVEFVDGKSVIRERRHKTCFAQNYFDIDLGN